MNLTPVEVVLQRLSDGGYGPQRNGTGWKSRCPAHDDQKPSLGISENGDGHALVICRAGCDTVEVLDALRLDMGDLFADKAGNGHGPTIVATYDYVDEHEHLLFQQVRLQPKDFRSRRPDGRGGWVWKLGDTRRVLYRLPRVMKAAADGDVVFVVEGEKDVHAIEAAGQVATCNPGGASKNPDRPKWSDEYSGYLRGADVIIVADRDKPGRAHAKAVARSLQGIAAQVRIVQAAAGKDVSDHLAAGLTLEELDTVLDEDDTDDENSAEKVSHAWETSAWGMVEDLGPILDGTEDDDAPTMLARTDGVELIYPAKNHSFHGETETGKTWAAAILCAERVNRGEHVLYMDFEDSARGVVGRLKALGVPGETIRGFFHYQRLDEPMGLYGADAHNQLIAELKPAVVIIDGVTEALVLHGWSFKDNDDIAKFITAVPRRINRAGPSTILVDHVGKDRETRGRFAIGGQHKLAGLDGAAYTFEIVEPFGRGKHGIARISVAKDRPGHVRRHADDRGRVAELHLAADDDGTVTLAELRPPTDPGTFQPTRYMEKVSRYLELHIEPLSQKAIEDGVGGGRNYVRQAIQALLQGGYLAVETGPRNARLHRVLRKFREDDTTDEKDSEQ